MSEKRDSAAGAATRCHFPNTGSGRPKGRVGRSSARRPTPSRCACNLSSGRTVSVVAWPVTFGYRHTTPWSPTGSRCGTTKSPATHPLLAAARELERRDGELAARIHELTQLEAEIAELRTDVERVTRFRAELPSLRERAEDEVRRAWKDVAVRHTERCTRETAVATAKDGKAAERELATAESAYADAKSRLERVREEKERIERRAVAAAADAACALERARELSKRAGGEVGDGVEQWAARARAAVFAERTHAEGERQRVQIEASELASAVTGEPLVGDVPRVRAAVEAAFRR